MKKSLRKILLEQFGYETWPEFRAMLKPAKHAYKIDVTYKCLAKGKKAAPDNCIGWWGLDDDPSVSGKCVTREFTYIRFVGSETIYRFVNSTELKNGIDLFDATGITDWDQGDVLVLEPMSSARDIDYAKERRDAIKKGTWEVKPRGPNTSTRKVAIHHNRPY